MNCPRILAISEFIYNENYMDTKSVYGDKLDPRSSHMVIYKWLQGLMPSTRVLDIGTATGTIGRLCRELDLILYGVEPNIKWADISRPFYNQIFCSELDHVPDQFLSGMDVVVCADVLEHMINPELSLQRLVQLQPNNTQFIISVPNIANIWVRTNLLFGKFEYEEKGILDHTHLRFFTKITLFRMLNSCGLDVRHFEVTPVPLDLISLFFVKKRLGQLSFEVLTWLTKRIPNLLAYQFITVCEKRI